MIRIHILAMLLLGALMLIVTVSATRLLTLPRAAVRNADWTPQFQTFDGVEMALVPAGCFIMGSTEEQIQYAVDELDVQPDWFDAEQPAHPVCFDEPFWIDRYEATNEQYGSIGCEETSSEPDQPRNCVTWVEAKEHCENRETRLPTEAEWEYAARGPDSLIFPWGDEFVPDNVVYRENSENQTAPVGSRPGGESWVGAYDLSGNLWEWVSTIYDQKEFPYPYSMDDGREDINKTDVLRVLRGGSWGDSTDGLRAADRNGSTPGNTYGSGGFRCARS